MSEPVGNAVNNNANQPADQDIPKHVAPRELTQTDQLNKKLLKSFFDRINQGDENLQRMMTTDNNSDQSDTWETSPGEFSPK